MDLGTGRQILSRAIRSNKLIGNSLLLRNIQKLPAKTSLAFFSLSLIAGSSAVALAAQQTPSRALTANPSSTSRNQTDIPASTEPVQSASSEGANNDKSNNQELPDISSSSVNTITTNISDNSTSVTVNGEQLDMPANGSVQKTIVTDDGSTHIDVTTQNNGSSSSFTSVNTNTFSSNSSTQPKTGP